MSAGSIIIDLLLKTGTFETDTDRAGKALKKSFKESQDAVGELAGKLKELAAVVGIGFGIAAFKEFIGGAIEAQAHLDDLSKKTGIAADVLGGIGFAAKQAGGDLESAVAGATKLNRSIAEAAAGVPAATEAFAKLSISVRDGAGQIKTADKVLAELADKFATYEDGPNKTALAIRLFGKAGADMIPVLDEGGKKLQENIEYFRRFSGVTNESAKASHEFEDTLAHISLISSSLGNTIAGELLGPLKGVADSLLAAKENGTAFHTIAVALKDVFIGLATGASFVVNSLSAMSSRLDGFVQKIQIISEAGVGGIAKSLANDVTGSIEDIKDAFSRFSAAGISHGGSLLGPLKSSSSGLSKTLGDVDKQVADDIAKAQKSYDDFIKRINAPITPATDALNVKKKAAPGLEGNGGQAEFDALLKQVNGLNAVAAADLEAAQSGAVFTEAQKVGAKIAGEYAAGLLKITPAQLGIIDSILKSASAREHETEAVKEHLKALAELTAKNVALVDSENKKADSLDQQLKHQQQLGEQAGKTEIQVKGLESSRLRAQAAQLASDAALTQENGFLSDAYLRQSLALTATADALDAVTAKSQTAQAGIEKFLNQYIEDANNAAKVGETLTQSLVGGLEDSLTAFLTKGKGGFHALIDSLIQEIIRLQVVKPLLASIFGGNGSGGLGGIISAIGGLFSSGLTVDTSGAGTPSTPDARPRGGAAGGTNMVQRDMITLLHKGEAVVPKAYNPAAGGGGLNVKIVNNAGASVRAQPGEDGGLEVVIERAAELGASRGHARVLSEIARGGPAHRVLAGTYGLDRRAPDRK